MITRAVPALLLLLLAHDSARAQSIAKIEARAPLAGPTAPANALSPAARLALRSAIIELRDASHVIIPAQTWLSPAAVAELKGQMRDEDAKMEHFYPKKYVTGDPAGRAHRETMALFREIQLALNEEMPDEGPFKLLEVRTHYASYLTKKEVSDDPRKPHIDTTKITAALTLHPNRAGAGTVYQDRGGAWRAVPTGDLILFSGSVRPKVTQGILSGLRHRSPDFAGPRLALFAFYNATGKWSKK